MINEIHEIISQIKKSKIIAEAIQTKEILPLKKTGVYDLLRISLKLNEVLVNIDDENYLFELEETAKIFEDFFDETYLTFDKSENNIIVNIVTTNLAKKFKEMIDKNRVVVLMSGTLHSPRVLKTVFGLDNFKIVDAEIQQQGKIEIQKTGMEMDCKYSNFSSGKFSRENYLKALSKCIEVAKRPVLVHVNSFLDLPSEEEAIKLNIKNLLNQDKLKEMQTEDKTGDLIENFKKGGIDILFSTKCARGIDFPGKECNSIVFTKYPNPNVQDSFWKILNKTNPQQYWDFYKDKAKRELLQKIYRGLRFKEDHVYLLSPDSRVLEAFENKKIF